MIWDLPAALRAINFFPDVLRLSQGEFDGSQFNLEPAQKFIVGSIFGWKKKNGFRRFRRAYVEIAKGSGKTPMAAGIGMYCLVADGEHGAQVFAAASMKSQAMYVFQAAVSMWRQSQALTSRLTPSGGNPVWNLADLKTGSYFKPISLEEGIRSGSMPSCALCDELHEHRNGTVIELLERGFKSRRQPLIVMITNSGSDRNSVCWKEHVHAVRCAAGTQDVGPNASDAAFIGDVIDDSTFSFVCGLDEGDDPLNDQTCWIKANPMLGVTFPVEEMRRAIHQAKALPGNLNNILRLHLCVWTDSETAWMSRETLESVLTTFDPLEHSGEDIFIGLDLSATQDMTVAGFCVRTGDDAEGLPTYDAWIEAWTPKDTLAERALRDEAHYELWERDGFLNAVQGKAVRFDFVAARIAEYSGIFNIQALVYDVYGFKRFFEPELDVLGLTIPILEHPQGGKKKGAESGLWMPGSKMMLEILILGRRIRLLINPVLISAMMSAATEHDPFGNFWFSKRRAVNRIDALVALAMAVGAATMNDGGGISVFDQMAKADEVAERAVKPSQMAVMAPETADKQAQTEGETLPDADEEALILRDPMHPRWKEMRDNFEARLSNNDEDY